MLMMSNFENIVAKREITHHEHFLLMPQCFQLYLTIKLSLICLLQRLQNRSICGKGLFRDFEYHVYLKVRVDDRYKLINHD